MEMEGKVRILMSSYFSKITMEMCQKSNKSELRKRPRAQPTLDEVIEKATVKASDKKREDLAKARAKRDIIQKAAKADVLEELELPTDLQKEVRRHEAARAAAGEDGVFEVRIS